MYTHEDIENMMQKAIEMCEEIGLPISKDICPKVDFPKATSFYGMCCTKGGIPARTFRKFYDQTGRSYQMYIRFSEYALNMSEQAVMNTLLHELCHTCPGCMNHGELWQRYGRRVYEAYGYDIKRCGGDKSEEDRQCLRAASRPAKHQYHCEKCGHVWTATRDTKVTQHLDWYRCRCKGHLVLDF